MKAILMVFAMFVTVTTFAQKSKSESDTSKSMTFKYARYRCAIHPEITSDKPGKCPKCQRDLTLSPKEQMKMEVMKLYTCPMHPDVVSKKPGKCPECGMDLIAKAKSKKG
jgi:hypothetical protein